MPITYRKKIGDEGERLAVEYLRKNNYRIVAKNFNCRFGEIDIIARRKNQLVFIEVKTKSNHDFGLPEQEFTIYKKQKMRRAIQSWFWAKKIENADWRVDLLTVDYSRRDKEPDIRHYEAVNFPY